MAKGINFKIEKEIKVLDSLKKVLNSNFPSVMAKISTVYFFKNSSLMKSISGAIAMVLVFN